MDNLPEDLLINILLRLPVRSLLRFKSVSKLWHSLISDPHFANSHFQRSCLFPDRLLYIATPKVRSIDFDSSLYHDSAMFKLNFPFTPKSSQILGSCRGFLLLEDYHDLFVWNPSTGSCCKVLTHLTMPFQFPSYIYGFGYDAFNDDYLIVRAKSNVYDDNCPSVFEFFSVKANSWEQIEQDTNFLSVKAMERPRTGLFMNGAIHWLAFRIRHRPSVKFILAFNLTERNFMEIPLLDYFYMDFCYLGTMGGCLSLCDVSDYAAEIWLMKEYGVKESWTRPFVVPLFNIPPNHFFFSLGLTQSGEIVGTDGRAGLVKCNDKGEVLEHRQYFDNANDRLFEAVTYTETLLSFPGR